MVEVEGGLEGNAKEAEGNVNKLEDNDDEDKGSPNKVGSVDKGEMV